MFDRKRLFEKQDISVKEYRKNLLLAAVVGAEFYVFLGIISDLMRGTYSATLPRAQFDYLIIPPHAGLWEVLFNLAGAILLEPIITIALPFYAVAAFSYSVAAVFLLSIPVIYFFYAIFRYKVNAHRWGSYVLYAYLNCYAGFLFNHVSSL